MTPSDKSGAQLDSHGGADAGLRPVEGGEAVMSLPFGTLAGGRVSVGGPEFAIDRKCVEAAGRPARARQ